MLKNGKSLLEQRRKQIVNAVWGEEYDGTYRTVDTIIKQIRIKLGDCQSYIKSIYGVGYIFEVRIMIRSD